MKTRAFVELVLPVLLAGGAAQASEWVSIGKNDRGTAELFVDVSSIRVTDSIRRAWSKMIFAAKSETDGTNNGKWMSILLQRDAFNCADETHRAEALEYYYEDGTHNMQDPSDFPTPWQPVVPDTLEYTFSHFVCSWKAK
jgi:hypothetical protein